MTGKIRLLLFWKGADDVGGGYIRRGFSSLDPKARVIQVLFGSDPDKAPRRINKWGTATEAMTDSSHSFFGFMTKANGNSVDEAESEIEAQAERGEHAFSAVLSHVDRDSAISRSLPLFLTSDFDFHEFDTVVGLVSRTMVADDLP